VYRYTVLHDFDLKYDTVTAAIHLPVRAGRGRLFAAELMIVKYLLSVASVGRRSADPPALSHNEATD